jgi:hypothetical protein
MKSLSVLLLVVLLITALAPTAALTYCVVAQGTPVLGMLNVCHQATPAVSSSGLMPFIHQCPCAQAPSLLVAYLDRSTQVFSQLILSRQYDRPPQA